MARKPTISSDREREIRKLWEALPIEGRDGNGLLGFYGWLSQNRSDLLADWKHGDPYQELKTVLRGRIREPR